MIHLKTKNWILNSHSVVIGPENSTFFLSLFPHSRGAMMMAKHDTSQEMFGLEPAIPPTHTEREAGGF